MNHLPLRHLLLRESLLVVGLGGLGLAGAGWWGARSIMVSQAKVRAETGLLDAERRVKASLGEATRTGEALAQMGRLGQLAPMDSFAGEQQLLAELRSRASLSNLTFVLLDGQASAANLPEEKNRNLWATRGTHFVGGVPQRILHLWNADNELVETGPDPAAPPDWRLRPWVIQGLREGRGSWTPPYQFLGQVGFGLTYTIPVSQAGKILGVLGVDLVLGDIRPWLNEAKPTKGTRLAILDGDGRLLVPPEQGASALDSSRARVLEPETLDPVRHAIPAAVLGAKGADQVGQWPQVKVDGDTFFVHRRQIKLDGGLRWELLVAVPEADLLAEPRRVALGTLALSLAALIILAWRTARNSRRIAEPLELLASQAESLVEGHAITTPETAILEVQNLAKALRVASIALEEHSILEGQLRTSQRREMIGTLAAGVAHDLGNILSAVGANLEMAQEVTLSEEKRKQSLDLASKALRRSHGFLRSLLAIGRPVEGDPGPLELAALIKDSAALLEPLLGRLVILNVTLPAEPLWIHGDPLQIEQVLLNLAMNGRDAMPRGGELSVAVGRGSDGRPYLSVADAGGGISPEVKQQLFLPFFTTKASGKGSGLGLAMVQGIARSHGAEIDVESELGQGSRFTLRFPDHTGASGL